MLATSMTLLDKRARVLCLGFLKIWAHKRSNCKRHQGRDCVPSLRLLLVSPPFPLFAAVHSLSSEFLMRLINHGSMTAEISPAASIFPSLCLVLYLPMWLFLLHLFLLMYASWGMLCNCIQHTSGGQYEADVLSFSFSDSSCTRNRPPSN